MAERRRGRQARAGPPGAQSGRQADRTKLLGELRGRASFARDTRENWWATYRVDDLTKAFLGVDNPFADDNEIRVNRFFPTIKTIMPSVFFQNPKFFVTHRTGRNDPEEVIRNAMAQAALEDIAKQEFNLKNASKLAIQQSFFSLGVLKIIYNPKLIRNSQRGEVIMMTDNAGHPIIDQVTGMPQPVLDPQTGEPLRQPDRIVSDETYRWQWVNAHNMLLPDEGPDMGQWTWIGEEVIVPLDEAKEDERFPRDLRAQLRANVSTRAPGGDESERHVAHNRPYGTPMSSPDELFKYCELWDIRERKYYIFADGQTFSTFSFLLEDDYPDGVEEHPYAILPGYTPIIDPEPSAWPLPLCYNWLGLQNEYSLRRRQMMEGAKRSARKGYYDDSVFADADEAIKALQSPTDMEFVRINDVQRPPTILQDPPLPGNIGADIGFLDRDWIRTTGELLQRGVETATEATLEAQIGQTRTSDMRDAVSQWLAVAGQKMLQRLQGTLTLGMYIRMRGFNDAEFRQFIAHVYGQEILQQIQFTPGLKQIFMDQFGQERWVELTREELEFEARVEIVPGSGRMRTLESDRRQLLEFMGIIGQAPQLAQSRQLMRIVASTFEFFDDTLIDELFALSERMTQQNAVQAGRMQGNGAQPGGMQNGAALQAAMGV